MNKKDIAILVVDDEKNVRNHLRMLLDVEGYQVKTAVDGEDALKVLDQSQGKIDIALVDIQMPRLDGIALLERLKMRYPRTDAVILTAYGTTQRIVQAMRLGAADFLDKPFDPVNLLRLLEEISFRRQMKSGGTAEELVQLAKIAMDRRAFVEARSYLKIALIRDPGRPEPPYWLGVLAEQDGDVYMAKQYYFMALEASQSFWQARDALSRLGELKAP